MKIGCLIEREGNPKGSKTFFFGFFGYRLIGTKEIKIHFDCQADLFIRCICQNANIHKVIVKFEE